MARPKLKVVGIDIVDYLDTYKKEGGTFWVSLGDLFLVRVSHEEGVLIFSKRTPIYLEINKGDESVFVPFYFMKGEVFLDPSFDPKDVSFLIRKKSFLKTFNLNEVFYIKTKIDSSQPLDIQKIGGGDDQKEKKEEEKEKITAALPIFTGAAIPKIFDEIAPGEKGYIDIDSLFILERNRSLCIPLHTIVYESPEDLPVDEFGVLVPYLLIKCEKENQYSVHTVDARVMQTLVDFISKDRDECFRVIAHVALPIRYRIVEDQVVDLIPMVKSDEDILAELSARLDYAVSEEDYEEAAKLKKEIEQQKKKMGYS